MLSFQTTLPSALMEQLAPAGPSGTVAVPQLAVSPPMSRGNEIATLPPANWELVKSTVTAATCAPPPAGTAAGATERLESYPRVPWVVLEVR
jgi:hypothetical protein